MISFALDEDQTSLRDMARQFFAAEASLAATRTVMETAPGYDPAVWAQLSELGLTGLIVADEHGGAGATMVEVGVLLREAGRALLPAPLLASTVAALALSTGADEPAAAQWLPGIADGSTIATLAVSNPAGAPGLDAPGVTAAQDGAEWLLAGSKSFVLHGATADLLLVTAATPAGLGLFAVVANSVGLTRTALAALDPTRALGALDFDQTPAHLVTTDRARIERAVQLAAICVAAEQVGGAEACLDAAVGYATTRVQFGRPIGSFQAIKHLLADVLLEVESARAAVEYATWAAAHSPDDLAHVASLAKAVCSDTYVQAASVNLQVHGGMGFTWEADAHLYLKRAMTTKQLFGSPEEHRERIAAAELD